MSAWGCRISLSMSLQVLRDTTKELARLAARGLLRIHGELQLRKSSDDLHIKSNMSLQARRSRLRPVVRAAQSSADMHGKITAIQQVQEYSTSIFETSTLLLA